MHQEVLVWSESAVSTSAYPSFWMAGFADDACVPAPPIFMISVDRSGFVIRVCISSSSSRGTIFTFLIGSLD